MNILNIAPNIVDPIEKFLGKWSNEITNFWTILLRLFIALICAGAIGVERARKRHAAGFRTYMLVSLGSTMVMMVTNI